jgi:hypothetical protein
MAVLVSSREYVVPIVITNPGAVSNLVIHAAATNPLVVIRAQIQLAQATIPTAANARLRLIRKTVAGTYTSVAATTFFNSGNDPDASFTAGHTATGEGTETDFIEYGWGSTTGWTFDWAPTPEEYIVVPAGTANGLAMKSNVAPPAGNYAFSFTVHQIG